MDILKKATEIEQYVVELRRHLHENPELSDKEYKTLEFIGQELDKLGIRWLEVENGGIFGFIDGPVEGKTVLLRADIDALPVREEANNLSRPRNCISKVDGVSHMCGHDAHTAMLLGTARVLSENKDEIRGHVILMFERGEEGTGNLQYLLQYLYDNNIKVDGCWGMHVMVEQESGTLAVIPGGIMAGSLGFDITIKGLGGHGSRPDLSNNPLDCFVSIYTGMNTIRMKNVSPFETLTFSVGQVECGTRANVIPETLRFTGTARAYDYQSALNFKEQLVRLVEQNCLAYGCEVVAMQIRGPGRPLVNNPDCCDIAAEALDEAIPGLRVGGNGLMGTESHAMTQTLYPGCFGLLGTRNLSKGTGAEHHTPRFDVDDDVLKLGVAASVAYALKFLTTDRVIYFEPSELTPEELYKSVNR